MFNTIIRWGSKSFPWVWAFFSIYKFIKHTLQSRSFDDCFKSISLICSLVLANLSDCRWFVVSISIWNLKVMIYRISLPEHEQNKTGFIVDSLVLSFKPGWVFLIDFNLRAIVYLMFFFGWTGAVCNVSQSDMRNDSGDGMSSFDWLFCSLTLSVAQGSWLSQLFYIAGMSASEPLKPAKTEISVFHLFKKFHLREGALNQ